MSSTSSQLDPSGTQGEPPFIHDPLSDAKSIRLLHLLPGTGADLICCNIVQCSFLDDTAPTPYTAISYYWGDAACTQRIQINGRAFYTTKNAEEALQHLRHPQDARTIWMDAICIDQQDRDERGHQIRLMRTIYAKAVETVAWIGAATTESNKALDFITKYNQFFSNMSEEKLEDLEALLSKSGINPPVDTWIDVVQLTARPWFSRIWVVQELCLSARVKVVCGGRSVSWEALSYAVLCSVRPPVDVLRPEREFHVWLHDYQVLRMVHMREAVLLSRNISMQTALEVCAFFQATEPHDYILGLLGLMNEEQECISHLGYNDTVQEIYRTATAEATTTSGNFSVIYQAQLSETSTMPGLPSWVPDFSDTFSFECSRLPFGVPYSDNRFGFCAGFLEQDGGSPKLSFCGNVMTVYGAMVDEIKSLSPIYMDRTDDEMLRQRLTSREDREFWHEWVLTAMAMALDGDMTEADHRSRIDSLICTLSGGAFATREECEDQFSAWLDYYIGSDYKSHQHQQDIKPRLLSNFGLAGDNGKRYKAIEFATRVVYACPGRRFCVTSGGMLGLVSRVAKVGDRVFVPLQSIFPLLLRPLSGADCSAVRYRLLGTCFMNGIMHGEGLKSRKIRGIEII